MGSESSRRKLRVLGLHGWRTRGEILGKYLCRWSPSIHDLVEFTFPNAPTPAKGKSAVEGIYEGPYFEWMQFNDDRSEFYGYEESIAFLVDYMEKNGPFDGLIGFSQGATICGALTAVQERVSIHPETGDKDPMKIPEEDFLAIWKNSVLIRHPQGHIFPRLDEEAVSTVVKFLKSVQS
ncbi:unnamed protein product [Calypogeia fissa]